MLKRHPFVSTVIDIQIYSGFQWREQARLAVLPRRSMPSRRCVRPRTSSVLTAPARKYSHALDDISLMLLISPPFELIQYSPALNPDAHVSMAAKIIALILALSASSSHSQSIKGLVTNFGGFDGLSFLKFGTCDHSKCAPTPKHYEELGCTPILNRTECCPKR
jgi:hypothetical protein